MRLRPRYLTIAAADLAGGVTAAALVSPSLHFAYRSAALHATIETAAALSALLAAYLFLGRLRHTGRRNDLLLFASLLCLGLSNLVFSAFPWSLAGRGAARLASWSTVAGTLAGAGLLVAASAASSGRVRRPRVAVPAAIALALGMLAVSAAFISGWNLSLGINPATLPNRLYQPQFSSHPALLGTQAAGAMLFGLAALGFTRRAERTGDELFAWLGASAIVAAIARVNFMFFPSLYSEWVYVGDFLRLGSYLLILAGAAREISAYQRMLAATVAIDERRRVARDLHDGLAQELAFIASQARAAADEQPFSLQLQWVASAAERALAESRRAISALTRSIDEPLEVVLAEAVDEIARRFGTNARVSVESGISTSPGTTEALLRVVREAVTNASRHGRARNIDVRVSNKRGLNLRISDDGVGFDPFATIAANGFGLVTMRERIEALGGQFAIRSRPESGTEIEVSLP